MKGKLQQLQKRRQTAIINSFLALAFLSIVYNAILLSQRSLPSQQLIPIQTQDLKALNHYAMYQKIVDEWDDALTIADGTTSSNLNAPIDALKSVRRAAFELPEPSPCFITVKNKLVQSMNLTIDLFSNIMANQIVYRSELNKATQLQSEAVDKYNQCLIQR